MDSQEFLTVQKIDDTTVAKVQISELTSQMTDRLLDMLRQPLASKQACKLILDLSLVKFMDSVALGTLVVLLRRIKQTEGRLLLVGLGGHCRKVVEVTGLHRVFELHEDLNSALEALKK